MSRSVSCLAFLLVLVTAHAAFHSTPFQLRVNFLENPVGIDPLSEPLFQWACPSNVTRQIAHDVEVEDPAGGLARLKQYSSDPHFKLGGARKQSGVGLALQPEVLGNFVEGAVYKWRVRVKDQSGMWSDWSEQANFTTALPSVSSTTPIWCPNNSTQYCFMRKQVNATRNDPATGSKLNMVSATVFITATGQSTGGNQRNTKILASYKLYLNGQLVGMGPGKMGTCGPVCPELSQKNMPGLPCDCDPEQVYEGYNALPFFSDDGTLSIAIAGFNYAEEGFLSPPMVMFTMMVRYEDGETLVVRSDAQWAVMDAGHYFNATCCASAYGNDNYMPHVNLNATLEPVGWRLSSFDDSQWDKAVPNATGFGVPLIPKPSKPIKIQQGVKPASVVNRGGGLFFIDVGREIQGGVRLDLGDNTPLGVTIEVRCGEEMMTDPDTGAWRVKYEMRTGNHYQDFWYTRQGQQQLEHFEYQEFRYVEVIATGTNVTTWPTLTDLEAALSVWIVRYDADYSDSAFTSTRTQLNDIWELCKYTAVATTLDMYTDSNTRQRDVDCGESIDISVNMQGSVSSDWAVLRYTMAFALQSRGNAGVGWAEWQPIMVMTVEAEYNMTGQTDIITKFYDRLKLYTDAVLIAKDVGLWTCPHGSTELGCYIPEIDWPTRLRDGFVTTPTDTAINAYVYGGLRSFARLANAVGNQEDAEWANNLADSVQHQMNTLLYDKEAKSYRDGLVNTTTHESWHSSVFSLSFGVHESLPQTDQRALFDFVKLVAVRDFPGNALPFKSSLIAMYRNDRDRGHAAAAILLSNGTRSLTGMLRQNATTTMESWDTEDKGNLTWSHPWMAAAAYIIPMFLFGIIPLLPGYREISFKPQLGPIESASITVPTIRGPVSCSVSCENTTMHTDIVVPGNAVGRVDLAHPNGMAGVRVEWNGEAAPTTLLPNGYLRVTNVESGSHSFVLYTQ